MTVRPSNRPVRRRRTPLLAMSLAGVIALAGFPAVAAPGGSGQRGQDAPTAADVRLNVGAVAHEVTVRREGGYLTAPSSASPERIVRGFVTRNRATFELGSASARSLVAATSDLPNGATRVLLQQVVDGVPVHTATLLGVTDSQGRLVMVSGRTAPTSTSGSATLTAGDAIGVAAQKGGAGTKAPPKGSATKAKGKHSYPNPYAQGLTQPNPVSAELVWFIQPSGLRLAWLTDVEVSSSSWYESVVDAQTGVVLDQDSRYSHAGPDGDVFTDQHPDASGPRETKSFSGVNGSWVSGTTTSGNNVNAYRDLTNANVVGYQPENADSHFRYGFTDAWRGLAGGTDPGPDYDSLVAGDLTAALDADLDAVITQLFYYTNDMHDWLWSFGFDEASGNFQVTNFSGEGVEGDPVRAEAQDGWTSGCTNVDGRCRNNANFGTGADGSTARMQMYMWAPRSSDTGTKRPYRDGSLDGDVIAHEYGHGVSNRLVPGGIGGGTNQSGSLGEGWSDAISLFRWADTMVGEYVTGNATSGIRNFAYDVHPWTYGSYSTGVGSPHRNGEIWAATMFDLGQTIGLTKATQRMLDGMRATGNGPNSTFLDARDGVLVAETLAGNGDYCAVWGAFAARGMGVGAVSEGPHAVPTEDFSIPAACRPIADAGGPYTTPEGTDVTLDGGDSKAGTHPSAGTITAYAWDLDNDGDYGDATGVTASFKAVGQDGVFTVGLQVTDEFGATATTSTTVTVTNVNPTVNITAITPVDEGGTVTISGTITDPGWLEPLTTTIDFDDGAAAVALTGTLENTRPDATLEFSVDKQYGDNGGFEVEVCATDLVGGAVNATPVCQTATAQVDNVDPTAVIDESGTQQYDPTDPTAFVLKKGEDLTVPASSEDPGSDDLTFTWDWYGPSQTVETPDEQTDQVNPPADDPAKSPSVQPRDVTLDATHAYSQACLYTLQVTVTDDDAGSADDQVSVVITGNATESKGHGWWLNQYRAKKPNDFTPAELQCYLDIVGHFSKVFHEETDVSSRQKAERVLNAPSKSPQAVIFDQQALGAWLNFANGSIRLDSLVDADGDGTKETTFGAVLLQAENVRIEPSSTSAQVKAQKDILVRIITQSGP